MSSKFTYRKHGLYFSQHRFCMNICIALDYQLHINQITPHIGENTLSSTEKELHNLLNTIYYQKALLNAITANSSSMTTIANTLIISLSVRFITKHASYILK